MSIRERIQSLGESPRGGLIVLIIALLATLIWAQLPGEVSVTASNTKAVSQVSKHPTTGVAVHAALSQPRIVQGGDGLVYLDFKVVTPASGDTNRTVPTDMIVVLDRSGSMGEGNKWYCATQAIRSLLSRLQPEDRLALITFDSSARLDSGLTWARGENLQRVHRIVDRLYPGASTNLEAGLLLAESIAGGSTSPHRQSRILLLSDGQANAGIVDPVQLGILAGRIADRGNVLSTIGMGLGFNETLMVSLADQGMGGFSYLEHLESLGSILQAELSDSRKVYAAGSELRIQLPSGVELIDAAGYPLIPVGETTVIRTGQLLKGHTKSFMATLRVPSNQPGQFEIGSIDFRYQVDGRSYEQQIRPGRFQIACLPPELKGEVVASIDKDVYQEAWLENNFGGLMKEVAEAVRSGERERSFELLDSYRDRLEEADEVVPGMRQKAAPELEKLEGRLDEAFQGRDQKLKQNRAAKSLLGSSQKLQRDMQKNNQ